MKPAIRVVADSVCDVPSDLAARLGITLIPAVVTIGEQSYLDDGVQLTRERFYDLLPTLPALPTTSACPLGLCREIIGHVASEADHVILIAVPAKLSAIYNNFRVAAEEVAPGRYTLIDSGQVTLGAGFQVLEAATMARDGHTVAEILTALEDIRPRVRVFAALNTLENVYKSGRVGWTTALAGRLLHIKPLVALTEGDVLSLDNIRTFKRAFERLVALAHEHTPFEKVAVLHTNNLEWAGRLHTAMSALYTPGDILVVNVNPPLGVHVGAAALGLALVTAH